MSQAKRPFVPPTRHQRMQILDVGVQRLVDEFLPAAAREPRIPDFALEEKLCFLRTRNVSARLTSLYATYARLLGRDMLDAVLRESYINLVQDIFMQCSSSEAQYLSAILARLISEAFMETISLLDDLASASRIFERMDNSSTTASSRITEVDEEEYQATTQEFPQGEQSQ